MVSGESTVGPSPAQQDRGNGMQDILETQETFNAFNERFKRAYERTLHNRARKLAKDARRKARRRLVSAADIRALETWANYTP